MELVTVHGRSVARVRRAFLGRPRNTRTRSPIVTFETMRCRIVRAVAPVDRKSRVPGIHPTRSSGQQQLPTDYCNRRHAPTAQVISTQTKTATSTPAALADR